GRAARVENAVSFRAVGRFAAGRRVAASREACQRDGAAPRCGDPRIAARAGRVPCGDQRRVRCDSGRRRAGPASTRLEVLHEGRRRLRAPDVQLGYDKGGRGLLRGRFEGVDRQSSSTPKFKNRLIHFHHPPRAEATQFMKALLIVLVVLIVIAAWKKE